MLRTLSLLISIHISTLLVGQVDNTFQMWLDYDHHIKLNGKWLAFSDYGLRWSDLDDNGFYRIHARPSIEYRISTSQAARGGVGLFYQNNINSVRTLEFRPWQGYILKWPNFGRVRFYHYVRLEERIVTFLGDEGSSFSLKGRYKIGTDIPLNNPSISVGTFFIPLSFELFSDLLIVNREVYSDRNRTEIGLGYRYNKDLKLKLIYTFQNINNNTEGGVNQNDHVIRITVSQNFGFD